MSLLNVSALALAASLLVTASTAAQPARGGAGPAGARGTGGVGFNAKHKVEQLEALKASLGATDEEWKTLSPMVAKVLDAKRNTGTGAGMSWTASNNAKPRFEPSSATPDTPPGRAMQAVRDAVAEPDAPDDALAKQMAAVREARREARVAYEAAQAELLAALTLRQQAILMTLGVVE